MTTALIIMNVLVYLAWSFLDQEFMVNNFLVSWSSLSEGRIWTLLTSVFSHNLGFHILLNMLVLRSFGPLLNEVLGTRRYIIFYLIAGVVASFTHSVTSAFLLHEPELPALGASGAIAGLVIFFSFAFPRQKLLLLGFIPLPALVGALVFVALDVLGLIYQIAGNDLGIGHGAHLGGALTGFVYFQFFWKSSKHRS